MVSKLKCKEKKRMESTRIICETMKRLHAVSIPGEKTRQKQIFKHKIVKNFENWWKLLTDRFKKLDAL